MLQRTARRGCGLLDLRSCESQPRSRRETPLMARIFADHVVLQRDRPIDVWGRARPGEAGHGVAVGRDAQRASADAAGRWSVALPAFRRGWAAQLSARTGSREQQVNDVLVGDVWLCSGQSNMEWSVRNSLNAQSEAAALGQRPHPPRDHPARRQRRRRARISTRRSSGKWPGPRPREDFSAVCYYFARELQKTVDVPQGLINSSWGGTRIETWLCDAGAAPARRHTMRCSTC